MQLTLPLSSPDLTLANAGSKGANLSALIRGGFAVPGGFVVTIAGYDHFVEANGLAASIVARVEAIDAADPTAYDRASAKIRGLFAGASLPDDLREAVLTAFSEAVPDASPVAVRSSATAEDLPDASFAGQQDTYLNIIGPDALLDAVTRCWASLWTGRAIAYRRRQSIAPDEVSLAVVVQQMAPAEVAGVLFAVNPVTGDEEMGMGAQLMERYVGWKIGTALRRIPLLVGMNRRWGQLIASYEKEFPQIDRDVDAWMARILSGLSDQQLWGEAQNVWLARVIGTIDSHGASTSQSSNAFSQMGGTLKRFLGDGSAVQALVTGIDGVMQSELVPALWEIAQSIRAGGLAPLLLENGPQTAWAQLQSAPEAAPALALIRRFLQRHGHHRNPLPSAGATLSRWIGQSRVMQAVSLRYLTPSSPTPSPPQLPAAGCTLPAARIG